MFARIIRVLNRVTVALAVASGGLILAAFVMLPLLGYAAATVAAVGTWSLALGAVTAGLFIVFGLLHRITTGYWFWGGRPRQAFSRRGWLLIAIGAAGAAIVAILFDFLSI